MGGKKITCCCTQQHIHSRSITDFPVPSALENIFRGKEERPEAPPRDREKDEAKRE